MNWRQKAAAAVATGALLGGAHNVAEKKEQEKAPVIRVDNSDKYSQNVCSPEQGPRGSKG